MTFSKLTLAIATVLTSSVSFNAAAIELYVDTKTKQIYAEPGSHRERLGTFERVEEGTAGASKAKENNNSAEIQAIREELELKTNEIKALEEHAKEAEEVKVKIDDGIEFKSKDGNFKAGINGRIQIDSQNNVTDGQSNAANDHLVSEGASIRRARLGVEGTFYKDYDYKFEYDFTRGNGTIAAGVTDAFLRWNLNKAFSIKMGSFKEPFSLEEATSNRYITFIERNMVVNAFIDNPNTYRTGFGANYTQERWQLAGSIQTEPVGNWPVNGGSTTAGNGNNRTSSGDATWELNGRLTVLPWMESKTKFWHVGASASHTHVNSNYKSGVLNNGGMLFTASIDGNVDRTAVLSTGNLSSATGTNKIESYDRYGAETAIVYGSWSAQAEYIQTDINGTGYQNNALSGYYGYMSYFLTGESRNYKAKTGAWDRLKPNRNFDMKGGWGAWELAAGYDALDLSSGIINGGRAATAKFGVNWYPNSHFRLMGNFIHVVELSTPINNPPYNQADLDMVEFRAQVDF